MKHESKKIVNINKNENNVVLEIAGMKETFQSLQELEEYAVQVCERCKERINGRFYVKDEPDGKIAIVHNQSKNALRLKDANAGIDYATLILQEVKKAIKEKDKLYAFLNSDVNKSLQSNGIKTGYANGYVAIPPSHPMHSTGYDDIDVDVWGGLTFDSSIKAIKETKWESIEGINFLDFDEIPEDYWVYGFDTCHWGDDESHDRRWCIDETLRLLQQFEDLR